MSEKIILFLHETAASGRESLYLCPDNRVVASRQENDAPVLYLLQSHPEIDEVLCVVTPEARETAWEGFREMMGTMAPQVPLTEIPLASREEFMRGSIPVILKRLKDGDGLWLDVTGIPPDSVMNLMLLSRALSYCGISTLGAVDASLGREVRDITGLIRLVDLLGGMQVLTGRGNVTILREYCTRSEAGASVNRVLDSLEELTETVTLCRTTEIPMRMMAFTEALKAADQMQDPLLQKLLSVFHTRFQIPGWRMEDHLTSPGLIQWYLNIGQIQEAMTVYTELIPSYLINVVGVIQVSQDMIWEVPLDYEDIYTVQFRQNFIRLSDSRNPTKLFRRWIEEHYEEICAVVRKEKPLEFLTPPAPLAAGVDNLVRVSRLAYPSNGPFDPCWAGRLPRRKGFLGELTNRLSKQPPKTSDALLKKAAQFPKQDMLVLMEHDPAGFRLPPEAMTIELLEELLPGSGYQVACPLEDLRRVCRDYLYIRLMRGLAAHSSRAMTIHQQEQISYLMEHNEGGYYTTPANLTVKSLSHSLSCCLENLRIAIANRRELEGNGGEPEEPEVQLTERSEVWETPDA